MRLKAWSESSHSFSGWTRRASASAMLLSVELMYSYEAKSIIILLSHHCQICFVTSVRCGKLTIRNKICLIKSCDKVQKRQRGFLNNWYVASVCCQTAYPRPFLPAGSPLPRCWGVAVNNQKKLVLFDFVYRVINFITRDHQSRSGNIDV